MSKMAKINTVLSGIENANTFMENAKKILGEVSKSNKETKTIPVHCNLAASYGTLTAESVKDMDRELKVMIAATVRKLSRTRDYSWKNVLSIMMQNPVLQPRDRAAIHRADKLIKGGRSSFNFDGGVNQSIVNEVKVWFTKLISDPDVLKDTKIDIDMMAKIVGASGASVDSFVTFFFSKRYYERTIVDVGILRYPDIEHPYYKLYRIELKAWSDCRRILFVQDDKNGIMGQYNCVQFEPRESIMKRLRESTLDKAAEEAEDLFA